MASKANEKRIDVTLECTVCKRRNYITQKNKVNDRERIEMKKYCRWDRQHTLHKETRLDRSASVTQSVTSRPSARSRTARYATRQSVISPNWWPPPATATSRHSKSWCGHVRRDVHARVPADR